MLDGITRELLQEKNKKRVSLKKRYGKRQLGRNTVKEASENNEDIEYEIETLMDELDSVDEEARNSVGLSPGVSRDEVKFLLKNMKVAECNPEMLKTVNKTFLTVQKQNLWKQIEEGELRPGSDEADILFTIIRLNELKLDLVDFFLLESLLHDQVTDSSGLRATDIAEDMAAEDQSNQRKTMKLPPKQELTDATLGSAAEDRARRRKEDAAAAEARKGALEKFVSSAPFNIGCAVAIFANVTWVIVEEFVKNKDNESSLIWVSAEGFFTLVFFLEFLFKFAHLKCKYFGSAWNCFDFFLVLMGFFGLVLSILTLDGGSSDAAEGSSESRVIRISRVLRTMRFLRLFRLFHARMSADKRVSPEVIATMKISQTMKSFVRSHQVAQQAVKKYFTDDTVHGNVELSRCLMQSHIGVHNAIIAAISEREKHRDLFDDVQAVTTRKHIVEQIEHFIEEALEAGAITNKNAGALLHPLYHEVSDCIAYINKKCEGISSVRDQDVGHQKLSTKREKMEQLDASRASLADMKEHLTASRQEMLGAKPEGDAAAGKKKARPAAGSADFNGDRMQAELNDDWKDEQVTVKPGYEGQLARE